MKLFLKGNNIRSSYHELKCKRDGTVLRYSRIGAGSTFILLANGVGTDFFMWLPFLKFLFILDNKLFEKYTLIVQSYRGLFEPDDSTFNQDFDISIHNCVEDIMELKKHAKISKYHSIIGWSTGAQVALATCSIYPDVSDSLCLLNPCPGETLHTALQPYFPLPKFMGKILSKVSTCLITYLKTLISTVVWDLLKVVANSFGFRVFLEVLSFFSCAPPEQSVYFHQYMRDVFNTRNQTKNLLNLILILDTPSLPGAEEVKQKTLIISGEPDFMTGVYHSRRLAKTLKNSKHVNFTMGSHFLLLEWPEIVAKEFNDFIQSVK